MPRSFAITTSAPSVQLDGSGQGEFTFTISNALGRAVRIRAVIEPEGSLQRGWLALGGEPERDLAPDGTQNFSVKIAPPPGTADGSYAFHLVVVNIANPDEEFAIGPSVSFQIRRPAIAPPKKFPMWIALLAAGVLLITLGAVGAGLVLSHRQPGTGGSGSEPTVSLSFNGHGTYVDLGQPPALDFTGKVTVEAWIRPRTTGGFHNILAHGYASEPPSEFIFRIFAGSYQVGTWNGMDHGVGVPIPPEDAGKWVHLAGVYDGSRWILYRNGQQLAAEPDPVGIISIDAPWAIGARGGGGERFFDGDIAEVRLWNVARTPEEIREDMRRDPKNDTPGLVGSWSLSEGRGTIAGDRSPSQAHGVLRGATWNTQ